MELMASICPFVLGLGDQWCAPPFSKTSTAADSLQDRIFIIDYLNTSGLHGIVTGV